MHRNRRLSDSVIIRSLCIGDLRFFETAIAKRAGIPVSNARLLMIDPGPLGFKSLYDSSGMPKSFFAAIQTVLRFALEETEYGKYRSEKFAISLIAKIRSANYHRTIENMESLLHMVGRAMHEPQLQ
jgi:uncharacterized protein (DUF2336 family)